jgi:hypothetical protein
MTAHKRPEPAWKKHAATNRWLPKNWIMTYMPYAPIGPQRQTLWPLRLLP